MEQDAPTKSQPALHARCPAEIQRTLAAEHGGVPFLAWRDGAGVLCIHTLDAHRRLTIGRRASNDIVLEDGRVSRVHAELEPLGEDWAIDDGGLSRNGTFVGNRRVTGRRRLADRDVLHLGATAIEYRRPAAGSTIFTAPASSMPDIGILTPKQRAVLAALARPCKRELMGTAFAAPASNGQVANEVGLSIDAVKGHLGVLYRRFEIDHLPRNQKRARLVECAFQWGLLTERDL